MKEKLYFMLLMFFATLMFFSNFVENGTDTQAFLALCMIASFVGFERS